MAGVFDEFKWVFRDVLLGDPLKNTTRIARNSDSAVLSAQP